MNKANNRGIVLCFLIYIVLCAAIVSIIEVPWVILPAGTEISINVTIQAQTDGETQPLNSNKWPTDIPGSCGLSGICFGFEDGNPLLNYLTNRNDGVRCGRTNPIAFITDKENFSFVLVKHLPLYLTIVGSVVLLLTWLIGVCSCCNSDCGVCTIYSVIAVGLTLGTSLFVGGGLAFFIFAKEDDSCIQNLCGDIESAFDFGDCTYGWSMIVAAGGILCGYIVAICSCVLSAKTPLRSITQGNQLVEVKPASAAGGRRDFVTSRA